MAKGAGEAERILVSKFIIEEVTKSIVLFLLLTEAVPILKCNPQTALNKQNVKGGGGVRGVQGHNQARR